MRFLLMMKYSPEVGEQAEAGVLPGPEVIESMTRFNEALSTEAELIAAEGLTPSKNGYLISFSNGKPIVTDGPFIEAKELIGGYWIIKTDTREQAIDLASKAPLGPGVWLEVRRIFEMTDFSQEAQEISQPVINTLASQRINI